MMFGSAVDHQFYDHTSRLGPNAQKGHQFLLRQCSVKENNGHVRTTVSYAEFGTTKRSGAYDPASVPLSRVLLRPSN